jgi:hypothetical protein
MNKIKARYCFAITLLLLCWCQKGIDEEGALVKVGRKVLSRDDFSAFNKMTRLYPVPMGDLFPGERRTITFMVETEVLYSKSFFKVSRSKIKNGIDWKWKQRYFPAMIYMNEIVARNMGFTDTRIEDYFKAHEAEYTDTITNDSTGQDSVVTRELSAVRHKIVERMFLEHNPPDSDFIDDTTLDSTELRNRWLHHVQQNAASYFLEKFYKERYDKPLPDSLEAWYGEGKIITPEDMELILSWIPENRRQYYENKSGKRDMAEWLLKWKLFSEQAEKQGFTETEEIKRVIDWAWKVQVALAYVEQDLAPRATEMVSFDSSMVIYGYWDDYNQYVNEPLDSIKYDRKMSFVQKRHTQMMMEKLIYELRRSKGVEFLQSDYRDDRSEDPEKLMATADSLRENTEKMRAAEKQYKILTQNFAFTSTGKKAFQELAKIQMEQGKYRQAIENYRKYLIMGVNDEKKCNTFFMIGFIYGDYLNKLEMAEINYKWILKHTPECELADDAEFMLLHLGEPMNSIEELQAEARRQGRKIEPVEAQVDTVEE